MSHQKTVVKPLVVSCSRVMLARMIEIEGRELWRLLCVVHDLEIDLETIDQCIMPFLIPWFDEGRIQLFSSLDTVPESIGEWFEVVNGELFRYLRPIE